LFRSVALLWAFRSNRISRGPAAWVLAALVAVDLWTIEKSYWQFSPPASQVYATDPAIEIIRKADQPGRVVAIDGDDILNANSQKVPNFFPAASRDTSSD